MITVVTRNWRTVDGETPKVLCEATVHAGEWPWEAGRVEITVEVVEARMRTYELTDHMAVIEACLREFAMMWCHLEPETVPEPEMPPEEGRRARIWRRLKGFALWRYIPSPSEMALWCWHRDYWRAQWGGLRQDIHVLGIPNEEEA